ncbi:acyl-CoA thioesterase [Truepera radiovictrix]|uniref:Thioesterase superfamily protein n=1 Tax=Truepera radiovictrix (strain DSM 17093 / CIP 108686 / LMG 22925 / RQ-24) TaxID=649638 RepID=D7CTR5_TRURR|nr:thioesterase family protein [Truepera radiovictrix]ADI15612.1 thioesterase superfamily protein [Truepera radiovictrix DSM 17093]WMT58759.1 thioesterase family protein [Truepera radiovictrix]
MEGNVKNRFAHTVSVAPADIDELGHVNNTVYLRYAEEVARAHSERQGLSLAAYQALGVVPVVRQHRITYFQSAVLGDALSVETRVQAFSGARAGRHTRIYRERDRALLAEVETDWVWVSAARGRPTRAPAAILEAFGVSAEG